MKLKKKEKKKKRWKKINIITGFARSDFFISLFYFFMMINPTIFTICRIVSLSIANMFIKSYKWGKILVSNTKKFVYFKYMYNYMNGRNRQDNYNTTMTDFMTAVIILYRLELSAKTKLSWTNLNPLLAQQVQGPTATSLILPQRLFAPMFPYSMVPLFLNLVLYLFETPDIDPRSLCCFDSFLFTFRRFQNRFNTTILHNIKLLWSFC